MLILLVSFCVLVLGEKENVSQESNQERKQNPQTPTPQPFRPIPQKQKVKLIPQQPGKRGAALYDPTPTVGTITEAITQSTAVTPISEPVVTKTTTTDLSGLDYAALGGYAGIYGYPTGYVNNPGRITSIETLITVTKEYPYAVPHPVPVEVERHVPIPVPHPVEVPVPKPYGVPVPHAVPVEVPKPVAVPVERPVPYLVPQPVAVPVPQPVGIPKPVAVPVAKPVAVPFPEPVAVPVRTPVAVPVRAPVAYPIYKAIPSKTPVISAPLKSPIIVAEYGHHSFSPEYGHHKLVPLLHDHDHDHVHYDLVDAHDYVHGHHHVYGQTYHTDICH